MNRMLPGIETLAQHQEQLRDNPDAYRPERFPHCGKGGMQRHGHYESAGINRYRVGDERALHERRSRSIMALGHVRAAARLHVKLLTTGETYAASH
jgi:hypothetical protein